MSIAVGVIAAAAAVPPLAIAGTAHTAGAGTLVLTGGLKATISLDPARCSVVHNASGNSLDITPGVYVDGWSLVMVGASDPASGQKGSASVSIDAEGYTNDAAATVDWTWTSKTAGHVSGSQLSIASSGTAGKMNATLAVSAVHVYTGPKAKPVHVKATWAAGTCKIDK